MNQATNPSIDSNDELFDDAALDLLDKSLDDIEDLPGFEVPVSGVYLLTQNAAIKVINDKTAVEITSEVMECIKQDNENEEPTPIGTKFSSLFFLTGEEEAVRVSMGMLKQATKAIGEHFQEANLKIIVRELMKDLIVKATCVKQKRKDNPELFRARLSNITVQ